VVVVEDGGPAAELEQLRARDFGALRVVWLAQPHAGPAAARNRGARHAAHQLLAFTDDDCRPRPGWVRTLAEAVGEAGGSVAGGHTVNALAANPYSSASQALVSYITAYGQGRGDPFFASNNIALARADFLRLGGFDETFRLAGGEDRDFSQRCAQEGLRFLHRPQAIVDHEHDLSMRSFWRQHFCYGHGAYRYHQLRTTRRGTSIWRDTLQVVRRVDLRFYLDLVRYPFLSGETTSRLRVTALLLLSQIPNALGFFAAWAQGARTTRMHPPARHAAP